jgi:predicted HAD superfamily Cof-like phosphohydrolase
MSEWVDMVREFQTACGVDMPDGPTSRGASDRLLRIRLLREELGEYDRAELKGDGVEIADALADIVYIAIGTALHYGIPIDDVMREVHRSNMAKVGPDGTVTKRDDGKILKPEGWEPPRIQAVLEGASR